MPAEPLADLAPGERAEEALARAADDDRPAELARARRARRSSSRLCSTVLPKPIPGSTQIRSLVDPGGDRRLDPLGEEGADLGDDVVVARVVLHRPRVAEHVHEHDGAAALGAQAPRARGRRAAR